uniref:Tegument protein UL7 n=1 Tax=Mastomys natalensis cytomegalovirus 2 TaxID=2973540 RepID=A0A9Y1N853_9BETA|nr:tegument protein UL7 [Mastomys natalensis cytomegalovirus 2]WEG69237.1 tegument protein UL7 [Mastomys natalensis cytomegalovirus 2]WEG69376.1 tegument protein UL7 [Mastomys natalensis cytomegalovirus 2]WEG69514.1 tegument protein UL7 [Mastomys natalensis cytomegalovirus 2]WEG69652.1 tegument protein UL7 [Mastomys natalensis cytomegalovirus 2]
MSNTLMVRGAMEVHNDRKAVRIAAPEIVSISVSGNQLWFHTDTGQLIPHGQYRADADCRASFVGFCLFFVLDEEDALTELRLSSIRAKHRLAVFRPKNSVDFALCLILFSIESLPLSRQTLENLVGYLNNSHPRTGLTRMIRRSCIRLICISLYLFFDVTDTRVMQCVPQICVLYKETQRANATILAETYFGVSDISSMSFVSLALTDRHTRDGDTMADIATDVLNATCNIFYVPLGMKGGTTVNRWLSNDRNPQHKLFPDTN